MEEKTIKFTADNQNLYSYNIHYYRYDGKQQEWDIWTWEDGCDGREIDFTGVDQEGFVTATITSSQDTINVITRPGNWSFQEEDRRIQMPQGLHEVDVWLMEDDVTVYYSSSELDTSHKIRAAFMDSFRTINLVTTKNIVEEALHQFYIEQYDNQRDIALQVCKLSERSYQLTVEHGAIDVTKVYVVGHRELSPAKLMYRAVLDDEQYYYDGDDLGLTYTPYSSGFKLWAPTAAQVSIALYEDCGQYNHLGKVDVHSDGRETPLVRSSNGVWSTVIAGDLAGKYYMFKVAFADGTFRYAVDPYARAVAANGVRAAIVNLQATDPEGWELDRKPPLLEPTDAILYELHVRDFSISESSGVSPCNRGKFAAFTEAGLTDEEGNKLGIDHLVELGITHVHLLPVYDFQTVNELTVDEPHSAERKYNWGYDPQNYNAPEGAYSSDARDPSARMIEFKQMIQALHNNGIRVVMDVVYNHTYSIRKGPFQQIVPGYFYRTKANGAYSNGSGCGNELATERPMVRKYIKDSVRYWAKEYHIDGFRFDLMGLIDHLTMKELTEELQSEIDASILIYGEPWMAASTTLPFGQQTLKGTQRNLKFSVFNDHFRSAIKGDSDSSGKGFATGNLDTLDALVQGVRGAIDDFTNDASESVNYVTAHDNLNLWDKIVKTQGLNQELNMLHMKEGALIGGGDVAKAAAQAKPYLHVNAHDVLGNETVKRSLLANGIVLTSQGIPFIHAGDEFIRSKYGDHNSYRSCDAINAIDWRNKAKFKEVNRYYQGLIKLRREHPAFRMRTRNDINSCLHILYKHDGVLAYKLGEYANGDAWKNIIVIYNGKPEPHELTLPDSAGGWHVVVNEASAGTTPLIAVSDAVKVAAISMMVLYEQGNNDISGK